MLVRMPLHEHVDRLRLVAALRAHGRARALAPAGTTLLEVAEHLFDALAVRSRRRSYSRRASAIRSSKRSSTRSRAGRSPRRRSRPARDQRRQARRTGAGGHRSRHARWALATLESRLRAAATNPADRRRSSAAHDALRGPSGSSIVVGPCSAISILVSFITATLTTAPSGPRRQRSCRYPRCRAGSSRPRSRPRGRRCRRSSRSERAAPRSSSRCGNTRTLASIPTIHSSAQTLRTSATSRTESHGSSMMHHRQLDRGDEDERPDERADLPRVGEHLARRVAWPDTRRVAQRDRLRQMPISRTHEPARERPGLA